MLDAARRRRVATVAAGKFSHAKEPFGCETLRLLRERGMMQKTLAMAAGVDRSYLSRALRGVEPPSLDMIERVGSALELPADYFIESQRARIVAYIDSAPDRTWALYRQLRQG